MRWDSPEGQALFAYKAFDLPLLAGTRVFQVEAGEETLLDTTGNTLRAEPRTAYRLVSSR